MTVKKAKVQQVLQQAGLRSTQQRLALGTLLFDGKHKHVTAEQVFAMVRRSKVHVSLATVYNTLHQFTEAGLLREVVMDSSRVYFDTNMDNHHHFFDEDTEHLQDIPAQAVQVSKLPKLPAGMKLERVDVIVRVSAKR